MICSGVTLLLSVSFHLTQSMVTTTGVFASSPSHNSTVTMNDDTDVMYTLYVNVAVLEYIQAGICTHRDRLSRVLLVFYWRNGVASCHEPQSGKVTGVNLCPLFFWDADRHRPVVHHDTCLAPRQRRRGQHSYTSSA